MNDKMIEREKGRLTQLANEDASQFIAEYGDAFHCVSDVGDGLASANNIDMPELRQHYLENFTLMCRLLTAIQARRSGGLT